MYSEEGVEIIRPCPPDLNVITGCDSIDEEFDASQMRSPLSTGEMKFHSPIGNEYDPNVYSPGALPLSQSQLLSPSPIVTGTFLQDFPPSPPIPHIPSPQSNHSKGNNSVSESPGKGVRDIVWLIHTLRYDGGACREEKKKAIVELKRLAKSASEDYWRRNCAQVILIEMPVD